MSRNSETRAIILERGLELVAREGLRGVSIGALARHVGMSKSGLYAHFGSKLDLQLALLERACELFEAAVLAPARDRPRGEARLEALFEGWLDWASGQILPGGCILAAASSDLAEHPGPLRERLLLVQRDWLEGLANVARSLVRDGIYQAELDPERFAFEVYALLLGAQFHARMLGDERATRWARAAFASLRHAARLPH